MDDAEKKIVQSNELDRQIQIGIRPDLLYKSSRPNWKLFVVKVLNNLFVEFSNEHLRSF